MITTEFVHRLPAFQNAMMLDVDATAFVAGAIFVGLMLVLRALLFDPYLKLVSERELRTVGASADAAEMTAQAQALQAELDARLARSRSEASAERDRLRAEGKAGEEKILAQAKSEAQALVAARAAQVKAENTAVRAQLDARADELADAITRRILPQA